MRTINAEFIKNFNEHNSDYQRYVDKIKEYNFIKKTELLKELFEEEMLPATDVETTEKCDYFDNLYLLATFHITVLRFRTYLVGPYDVYTFDEDEQEYVRDDELSKNWRKIMKNTFKSPKYLADLKKSLEIEREDRISDVNDDIDEQLADL